MGIHKCENDPCWWEVASKTVEMHLNIKESSLWIFSPKMSSNFKKRVKHSSKIRLLLDISQERFIF